MSLKSQFIRMAPDPIVQAARIPYRQYRQLKYNIFKIGDRYQLIGPDTIYNEEWYASMDRSGARRDAQEFADAIETIFDPESVIDLGCGIGLFLRPFDNRGCTVHGVEGTEDAINHSVIDIDKMEKADLREPYSPPQTFDLAICFEVAEHLPAAYADTLVESIVQCSDKVAFTAASPGQGGTYHVNEQPPEYWVKKFEHHNYHYRSDLTQSVLDSTEFEEKDWLGENLLLFTAKSD